MVSKILYHTRGDFFRRLIAIAMPITLQSIMFSSRSLVDVLMLGQLGEAEIAAVGVAARATFVTTIMLVISAKQSLSNVTKLVNCCVFNKAFLSLK